MCVSGTTTTDLSKSFGYCRQIAQPLTSTFPKNIKNSDLIKDLRKRKGYGLERLLFVDNTPTNLEPHYGNLIGIGSFEGDLEDNELEHLSAYLPTFDDVADVRPIE
ncbi:MAG: NIF family HAD-type phosphatase, partial [Verrucomicrobiia bacterium]